MRETLASTTTEDGLGELDEELRTLDAGGPHVEDEAEALDPAARARIVERTVVEHIAAAPAVAQVIRPRRWWILGPVGIAAGLGIVILGGDRGPDPLAEGEVQAFSAVRNASPEIREITAGQPFYLRCKVPGVAVEPVSIHATRAAPAADEAPRTLGFVVDRVGTDGTELYTHADLPTGTWDLTCGVRDPHGHFQWLRPPIRLSVE
jgi:hypothetical protein